MNFFQHSIFQKRDEPFLLKQTKSRSSNSNSKNADEILVVVPVNIIPEINPIYTQIIKLINENFDEEIIFKNICRYMKPGSYCIILKTNFGLNDNMIIDLLKFCAVKHKNLLAILIITYYQQCMFNYNKLVYRELTHICACNKNKDLLIWIAKSTYNKKTSKRIYKMIDRI
jgi:hypothetical protein